MILMMPCAASQDHRARAESCIIRHTAGSPFIHIYTQLFMLHWFVLTNSNILRRVLEYSMASFILVPPRVNNLRIIINLNNA